MQFPQEACVSNDDKQLLTSELTSMAALSAHWVALAQCAHLGLYDCGASTGGVATKRWPKASLSAGFGSLRLEDLLLDAGSSSATPSTSATSSPRGVPPSPPPGLVALPEMAGAGLSPLSGETMAPPPGLPAPPQLALPPAWALRTAPAAVEESSLPVPPGLLALGQCLPALRPPPGLVHPAAVLAAAPEAAAMVAAADSAQRVEWRIHHVLSKLKTSAGFALVSPPLQVGGIADVRLHFAPGEAWAHSMRCRKSKKAEVKAQDGRVNGSMNGSLRLKLGDLGCDKMMRFYLFVGDVRQGPFECNFAERNVQEFQLGVDWRKHVEKKSDSLCLRLEVLSQ